MKVSIITATFNSEKFILDNLKSVHIQTYKNIEHIIIDGVSSDSTIDIIQKNLTPNTRFISEPDNSMYDAINKGMHLATGDIVGVLNSDDFLVDEFVISRIVKEFQTRNCEGIYGNIIKINGDKSYVRKGIQTSFSGLLAYGKGSLIPHPTLYVTRKLHNRLSGYDLSYKYASDFDYILRSLQVVKLHYIDSNITAFRVHPDSITSSGLIKSERKSIILKYKNVNLFNFILKYHYYIKFFMKNIKIIISKVKSGFEK